MMCVSDDPEEIEELCSVVRTVEDAIIEAKNQATAAGDDLYWLELDETAINDEKLKSLELSSNFPVSTFHISCWIFGC